jgi:hypothetical protein
MYQYLFFPCLRFHAGATRSLVTLASQPHWPGLLGLRGRQQGRMGCVDPGQEAGGCVFRPALGFLSHAGRGVPAPRKVADPGLGVDLSLSDAPEVEPFIAGPSS